MASIMNPVLILTRNNLDLTKRCVDSVLRQDVRTSLYIIDNNSTDGTTTWLDSDEYPGIRRLEEENEGVSRGWNRALANVFSTAHIKGGHRFQADHCLVVGNDTVLAPWTYSALLSANVPFVSGVDVGMSPLPDRPDVFPLSPHPDFSCFLIRRDCWETVGPFNEAMKLYASDCDYHIRAHRLGVPLYKASVPYNHTRSSTMNRATPQERHAIAEQANKDRAVFKGIYGCLPGTAAYNDLFKEAVK